MRNKYLIEIDENINKKQDQWEIWSGVFNRKLREDKPKKQEYIFTYWQIQNKIKRDGDSKYLQVQKNDIEKMIYEK